MSGHMCPGASVCPDCDPEEYERGNPGYIPGGAGALADKIIAEGPTGRDDDGGDGWNVDRHTTDKSGGPRSSAALPEGYGDEAARGGYDPKTGK